MKILTYIFLTLTLLYSPVAKAEIIDRIVAIVNDKIITESGLNAAIIAQTGGLKEGSAPIKVDVNTKSFVLDSLIEQQLMKQSADKAGIDVSEADVDRAVEDIKERSSMTEDTLLIELAKTGLTYSQYREQLKEDIRQSKFIAMKFRSGLHFTENDLKEYYTQNISQFGQPQTYRVSIIFLKSKSKLKQVTAKLKAGAEFSDLAREFSTGAGASSGGDLGYFALKELDGDLKSSISKMTVGEVSKPITSKDETRIIKLTDIKDGTPMPLEDVSGTVMDMLKKALIKERYNAWLEKMKNISHIEVRL